MTLNKCQARNVKNMLFEAFMMAVYNKVFLGNQPCQCNVSENVFDIRLIFMECLVQISAKTEVFLSPSRQMPGYYLNYATTASFQILSNSWFIYHSAA
jgi:hypothetical protein